MEKYVLIVANAQYRHTLWMCVSLSIPTLAVSMYVDVYMCGMIALWRIDMGI